ncbi:MAG TPA: matrixin family metalloprotease, partial [Candidatus Polarisedimenticolia bacterium]|nr:matrixin family metalloprotease [Candidatus Polarisedimenticolia bacterium]
GNLEHLVNNGTAIAPIAWDARALPIPWKINEQGVTNNCNNGNPTCVGGVSPLTLQRAIDSLTASFTTWQDVPTSRISFTFAGTTTQTTIGTDTVHLMTWADTTPALCPAGVLAVTPNTSLDAPLTVGPGTRDVNGDGLPDLDPAIYPDGTVLAAGTIIDADMAWCPTNGDFVDFPLDTATQTYDMGAVGTHEIGHFHGLSHSSLITPLATMLPFVDNAADYDMETRTLSADDVAATSRDYPEASFATDLGAITGSLVFPGTTTPATGVSVTAFDTATGQMAVQVFSVSQFTATAAAPGSFRIDGLPPGSYHVGVEYFDSTTGSGGAGDDDWWDNNRYNLTIYNSNVSGGTQPRIVRPAFLTAPETGTDDLSEATTVTVAAGQTVNVGTLVINSDAPPAPSGATALNLPDDGAAQVLFPGGFSFPFYGQTWSSVFVNSNGNLTFGVSDPTPDTRNFLGPLVQSGAPAPPRIAVSLTDLDPSIDNKGQSGGPLDVFSRFVSDPVDPRLEIIYLGVPVYATTKSSTAIARLFQSGRIEIQYRFFSAWWGAVGVSPGGNGSEPAAAVDLSAQLPFSGGAGQAIYEHFEFAQPTVQGGTHDLKHAFDLNGGLLAFTPNAAGGYDASSPNFVGRPPGEILNLHLDGLTSLAWDARADAVTYDLYRGGMQTLVDSDHDGVADGYGVCLVNGLVSPATSDSALPAAGSAFFYLVTGRNPAGEGPLGAAGNGLPRPNTQPCP